MPRAAVSPAAEAAAPITSSAQGDCLANSIAGGGANFVICIAYAAVTPRRQSTVAQRQKGMQSSQASSMSRLRKSGK